MQGNSRVREGERNGRSCRSSAPRRAQDLDEAARRRGQDVREDDRHGAGVARPRSLRLPGLPPIDGSRTGVSRGRGEGLDRPSDPERLADGDGPMGIDRLSLDDPQAAAILKAEFQGLRQALLRETSARPFGRRIELARAADDFAIWCDRLIPKLVAAHYDRPAAQRLLRLLVENARRSRLTFDAARHVAWSIKVLAEDADLAYPVREKVAEVIRKMDAGLKFLVPPPGRSTKSRINCRPCSGSSAIMIRSYSGPCWPTWRKPPCQVEQSGHFGGPSDGPGGPPRRRSWILTKSPATRAGSYFRGRIVGPPGGLRTSNNCSKTRRSSASIVGSG